MPNPNNLIFFIHVPKTAGSTINHYFEKNLNLGYTHCEAFVNNTELLTTRATEADWLSGHVTRDSALRQ